MKVAVSSDHRGYKAKELVKSLLAARGHAVEDFGCDSPNSCDYPDTALPAAQSIACGRNEAGVFICGTGVGMSITANKVPGIRASLCHDELTAQMARRHNNANVLCLPGDLIGEELMRRVVETWLATSFDTETPRHARRLAKIAAYETNGRVCGDKPPGS